MDVGILILKGHMFLVVGVMFVYMIRHIIFTLSRTVGRQKIYYHNIIDSDLPVVSILLPMHNEEKTAYRVLNALVSSDYPKDKMEIIPIDDNSTDGTRSLIEGYSKYSFIKPIFRCSGKRGKPRALNDGLEYAKGEIIIVFDADYLPSKRILHDLVNSFKDPEVGAVMGRVIPDNTRSSLVARLMDLERAGGYQIDQQARYNLNLICQYGGTVGGFRREVILSLGGFDVDILAEDTELTFRLFCKGWKVIYANKSECYEEAPENWEARAKQIRRWARGHTQTMFKYIMPVMKSPFLSLMEKIDGVLLLGVYTIPTIILTGIIASVALFFLGELKLVGGTLFIVFVAGFSAFGNFAPFFEIATALLLDGSVQRIRLIPMLISNFAFNIWHINMGFFDAVIDLLTKREIIWHKTERFKHG